jgi:hypothetical protein
VKPWPDFVAVAVLVSTLPSLSLAGSGGYESTVLGVPAGADGVVGVRLNNLGHVAGWSQYFGQAEPSLKGWTWTPEDGFTVLPPPPGFYQGRSRAMDINDNGGVAGDGGYDIGLAWRYESGVYTVTGGVEGMPGAYLGGINNAGDLAGTAKDDTITTPDFAFLDESGGSLSCLTPGGGRATDLNDNGQVCGIVNPLSGPFEAFRWDTAGGIQTLGTLGLAFSHANRMNDGGDVVGVATSGSGNTNRAWIYTDAGGMQALPAPYLNASSAIAINNHGHVVGISERSGPDLNWLWTGGESVTDIAALFDTVAANVNVLSVRDINDAGQILVQVFDNNVPGLRMLVLTPPGNAVAGDINGDGLLNMNDVGPFASASIGTPMSPEHMERADVNGDGATNASDIQTFIDAMMSP